jgi:hypothetical protein
MSEPAKRVPAKLCIEQGVCINCGLEPLVTGRFGARCQKAHNDKQARKYREKKGVAPDAPKFTHTAAPKVAVTRQCLKQRRNAANGLCTRCSEPAANGTKQCLRHLEATRELSRNRYRRKAGIPLSTPKGVRLPNHLKKPQ